MKIAVLGGGISGLVAARELSLKGHQVTCLEAASRPGGLCKSELQDGFVCDRAGGHIIYSKDQEVLRYMLDLLEPKGHHTSQRHTFIYEYGLHVRYPFENGLSDLDPARRFECLAGYVEAEFARRQGREPPGDFEAWCLWRFGAGICRHFMFPYNRKIWKVPLAELGTRWVSGRVPNAPLKDVLRSALGIHTEGYTHQSIFHYPLEGGFEGLIQGLLRELPQGVVQTETPCRSLEGRDQHWLVNGEEFQKVISTIPLRELGKALKGVPQGVRQAFESLDYLSLLTVFLALDQPALPPHSWVYFPLPEDGPHNRITYLSNYSPHNAPPGKSSIMAEVTYHHELPAPVEQIAAAVVDGLVHSGFVQRRKIMWTRSFRNQYAYILYKQGLEGHLERVRNHCRSLGLELLGRFGNYDYFNSDGCVRAALDLTGRIQAEP